MKISWLIWFTILVLLAYTPFLQKIGFFSGGVSQILAIWIVLTIVSLFSVFAFAIATWGEWE